MQVQLAEYNALRQEMIAYHDSQKWDVYFAMLVLAGAFAILFSPPIISGFSWIYLIFPLIFTSIALSYVDLITRILRHASYIHHYLRKELADELGTPNVLLWEVFKNYQTRKQGPDDRSATSRYTGIATMIRKIVPGWLRRDTPGWLAFLDYMRVGQFVAPSVFTLLIYVGVNLTSWSDLNSLALVVSFLVAMSPIFFFTKARTSKGVKLREDVGDLVKFENLIKNA